MSCIYFTFLNGVEQGRVVQIEDYPVTIGSKIGESLFLNDSGAPFKACTIERLGEHLFISTKLKKKNTILINGEKLICDEKKKLYAGDVIQIEYSLLLVGINQPLKNFLKELVING